MPTFRNQMRVICKISFAEWGNQPDVSTSKGVPGSKALKAYINWALVLFWKILLGEQIHNCSKAFHFNKLTDKSCFNSFHSSVLPHFRSTENHCTSSKCSFLQENVKVSQSACEDCSLPDEEGKGMKLDILESFQSPWVSGFPNLTNVFCFSNCVSTQPRRQSFFCFFGIKTVREIVPILDGTWNTSPQ